LSEPLQSIQVKRVVEAEMQKKGGTENRVFEAEVLTAGGLQGGTIIPRKLGTSAIKKYNPDLYEAMAEAGHLVFLHKLAGYEVKSEAAPKARTQAEILLESIQLVVDMERRQAELEQQNALLVSSQQNVQADVHEIKTRAAEAGAELKALPPATKEPEERSLRANLNTLVRAYCHANNVSHPTAWGSLYREFRDRYHVDLKIRAANGTCKPLDVAQSLGLLEDLYAVAETLFALS
jgi:hypothetical protein